MSLELSLYPEFEMHELREELRACLHKILEADDFQRLRALDCALYVPPTVAAATELERRGLPVGGVVQVCVFVCRIGDGESGELARCEIPRLLKFSSIRLVAQQFAEALVRCMGKMDREMKQRITQDELRKPHLIDTSGTPLLPAYTDDKELNIDLSGAVLLQKNTPTLNELPA